MSYIKVFLFIICFTVLTPVTSLASTFDSDYIRAFAKDYLESKISPPEGGKTTITIANIDSRIIIKPCQRALKANIPENYSGRNVNVKITCDDPAPWKMFIPAKIENTFAVVVATTTIEKNTLLTESNINVEYIASNKIRGKKLSDMDAVLGSKTKKRVAKGRAINSNYVCLVCKGDTVTIIAKSEHFMIKTRGTALSDGNVNQQIKVRNIRSGKIITPKVSAINQVTIHL
ncbi:MAG: flagellar basal body P-ring formation chaperone FlgA [Colwellia sp.]|nr:flagellar basal body P-ring formation chaperone FlgA [Colwellia sp.]MCW8863878.1 flagellar basal body P-ring formation chaperone FlgA [Colwellia sp.]MCW9081160.1 flagellar basal body P-ring formation chaperone FlgA [Colwellia sp.]